jgi:hypothetical protein
MLMLSRSSVVTSSFVPYLFALFRTRHWEVVLPASKFAVLSY